MKKKKREDHVLLALPRDLFEHLKRSQSKNGASLQDEIIARLERSKNIDDLAREIALALSQFFITKTEQAPEDRSTNASMTIAEWCAHRRISRSMAYKLWEQGQGPTRHYIGTKALISSEADRAWARIHERERTKGGT